MYTAAILSASLMMVAWRSSKATWRFVAIVFGIPSSLILGWALFLTVHLWTELR
jgi:hypothetical protein